MNKTDRLTRGLLRIWMTIATIVYTIFLFDSCDERHFGQVLFLFPLIVHLGGGLAVVAIIRAVKWIIDGFKDGE